MAGARAKRDFDIKELMRPLKRRIDVMRGRDIIFRPTLKLPLESHGTDYGGAMIVSNSLNETSVVYSFGIGEDMSFDASVAARYGCQIHGFDPTPRAIEFARRQALRGFTAHNYGLSDATQVGTFYLPIDQKHVSGSLIPSSQHDPNASIPVAFKTFVDVLTELGHDHVDLVKMDIEAAEYQVIESVTSTLPASAVDQWLIEFHHRILNAGVERTQRAVIRLFDMGYELAWVSPRGEQFLFVLPDAYFRTRAARST